ncbi:hypothetical protein GGX14DRAFT_403517 [Mycena pura]|uniref:Uncharacterized protein n=1 Tax=Mycena pura TaxID=153505 RepID=A0AAD6Y2H5_9AGAR|nr:hypothetical protein GGX14DRAFT_403517 [Mycena pura]
MCVPNLVYPRVTRKRRNAGRRQAAGINGGAMEETDVRKTEITVLSSDAGRCTTCASCIRKTAGAGHQCRELCRGGGKARKRTAGGMTAKAIRLCDTRISHLYATREQQAEQRASSRQSSGRGEAGGWESGYQAKRRRRQ